MLITFSVAGYRSLRNLVIPLERLNLVTGANGSGKSSLYRAIRLLSDVAQGRVISALAQEGGLHSTLWAGPETISRRMESGHVPVQGSRRSKPISLKLGFADTNYGYAIDLGLPQSDATSAFNRDPMIKCEAAWVGEVLKRRNEIASRSGPSVTVLASDGSRKTVLKDLASFDSMMTHAADPENMLELLVMREGMKAWRFYDHFRTDAEALARRPQVGTRTPVLSSDGHDLASAIQTIVEIGDRDQLAGHIDDAFPGAELALSEADGLFELTMIQRGLLRPLRTAELSDGTLRYLLLVAALLSPRPPSLLVLNEPETSLHADLLPALSRLIVSASKRSQVIVVSHAAPLVKALIEVEGCSVLSLHKTLGETRIENLEEPPWSWPKR
ncbi:MAG: AAA family ATPase [Hyphomicrobiaceae bacterium]|nr:AAA family ATPase [Hyphomicrobiaceae bacterium]